ncbi:hypothetical protein [Aquabacterium parvum]|uniref:hypothetical protein n=1 Tax=Aquabacterium parvum TaxID=70584 RepID=UPI000718E8C8|nr:hypothetical protein [Aquabacterium parvum]
MAPRNLSQEAHLWYTISSPDYIARAKVKLQEAADLMHAQVEPHPFIKDYAPVPYWGGVIEDLLSQFDNALAILKHGDFSPMNRWASRMQDIPRGLQEGNMNWMSEMGRFMDLLNDAYSICSRFSRVVMMSTMYGSQRYKDGTGDWHHDIPEDMGYEGNNIARNSEEYIFPILPEQIPEYVSDTAVSCRTGDIVPWTGVWVPSTGMGTAALAFARQNLQIMQPAYEIASRDEDGYASFNLVDCIWHPVKPTGRMIEHPVLAQLKHDASTARGRCESGERCPREGWWFTPAVQDSRRFFKLGEVMPKLSTDYGQTIWQWNALQA